jgi:hypothetical protein
MRDINIYFNSYLETLVLFYNKVMHSINNMHVVEPMGCYRLQSYIILLAY